jgi:8-oxo-dGTP pyrophosphatase MutT (NUDIX family)
VYFEFQDEFNNCFKESGNTQVDKQQVWVQLTRGRKRGRYYGLPGIIDKDHAHRSSTPVLTNGTQPMYTQQQVQDIVSQAVTSAVREVREELGTRIQSLERIVDKPNTESHSHVSKQMLV